MILVVNIAKEKLHYLEFVKPITDILDSNGIRYAVKNYKDIKKEDFEKCEKVIICGTSLYDNEFLENLKCFKWILNFDKPLLGICGGMQIIGIVFGGKLKKKTEIGYYFEEFNSVFLGLNGKVEVYHLHNNYVDFSRLKDFENISGNEISQSVKHYKKAIYGVLFHPEVRQKELVVNFSNISNSIVKQ